jgi:cytochrome c peroxidase
MFWMKPKNIDWLFIIPLFSILMFAATGARAQDSSQAPPNRPSKPFEIPIEFLDQLDQLPGDLGPLPAVPIPADNPQTPEKIELGKLLFFDPRLSGNGHWACATCHNPSLGYSDGLPRALGFMETELGRHTPTILNAAYNTSQFWDGRAKSLEEQAKMPVLSKAEMNMLEKEVVSFLNGIPDYRRRFKSVFGGTPTLNDAAKAIASFERTLVAGDSRFDRYMKGDKKALTIQEKKGLILFMGKASCTQCHNGPNFSDSKFHNVGTKHVGPLAVDHGRMNVTSNPNDMHAFKTPTLRNIAITPPYMHDGVFSTLEQVVEFYNKGGENKPHKSPKIFPLNLTDEEKANLVAFMKTLTSEHLPEVAAPQLPQTWD